MSKQANELSGLETAVVGMAVRVPGADTVDEFWQNLLAGKNSISYFADAQLLDAGIGSKTLSYPPISLNANCLFLSQ